VRVEEGRGVLIFSTKVSASNKPSGAVKVGVEVLLDLGRHRIIRDPSKKGLFISVPFYELFGKSFLFDFGNTN
jgi:hypothetical protein